jgi:hypothetical protein
VANHPETHDLSTDLRAAIPPNFGNRIGNCMAYYRKTPYKVLVNRHLNGLSSSATGSAIMTHKRTGRRLFDHPSDMEPLLPEDVDGGLADTALLLIRRAERLRGLLHPVTRKAVAQLVRSMNSYYSNLIEGHRTTPGH